MADRKTDMGRAIEGIFSTHGKGPGSKEYWLVKEIPGGRAEVRRVNERLVPYGQKKIITLGKLLEDYEPEPEFYVAKTYDEARPESPEPKPERSAKEPPVQASDRSSGPSAQTRKREGVALDLEGFDLFGEPEEVEKNARAGFGMGLAHLKRGNLRRAKEIFERLAEADAELTPEHKHMFNDFGITLRKQHLADTAVKNYGRALGLSQSDENLHFNIARAYYDLREYDQATKHLDKALELNPGLMEARMFVEYIRRKRRKSSFSVMLDSSGE